MAFDEAQRRLDDLAARFADHLGYPRENVEGVITAEGDTLLRVKTPSGSEIAVRAGEDGEWIATEAQDDGSDAVMVLDENLDVKWSGRVVRGDPDTN